MRALFLTRRLLAPALFVALAMTGPVLAHVVSQPGSNTQVSIGGGQLSAEEARDWDLAQNAYAAFARGGYSGLAPFLPALKTAIGRVPASYAMLEVDGPRILVRSDDGQSGMARALMAAVMVQGDTTIETQPNVYETIALLLASEAVEHRRPEEAIQYLDIMLQRQPDNLGLISQRSAALSMLGRHTETVVMIDNALAEDSWLSDDLLVAVLHRHRGFALIEMGALDDAEASYRTALELQPGHAGARSQLDYIAILRDGGEKRQGALLRPQGAGPESNPGKRGD